VRICRIEHLRDLKQFFGTTFKIKPITSSTPSTATTTDEMEVDPDNEDAIAAGRRLDKVLGAEKEEFVLSCVGTGFVNTNRRAG